MPRLVERAGTDAGPGSITASTRVLAEGDDLSEPVAEAARAALDGHVVLSRKLANAGHFPAVDVLASVSRVMGDVVAAEHKELALAARELLGGLPRVGRSRSRWAPTRPGAIRGSTGPSPVGMRWPPF